MFLEQFKKDRVVRRRTSQVQIAFDFFLKSLRCEKPDVSFFFTNHVASSMHRYWPSIFPEDYENLAFDEEWLSNWRKEIPFTLHEADYQLSRLMKFADSNPDYLVCLCTSMGQAAVQGKERIDRKVIITKLKLLMRGIGLLDEDWEKRPAMVPQYNCFIRAEKRSLFEENVKELLINGACLSCAPLGDGVYRLQFSMVNQDSIVVSYQGRGVEPAVFGIENIDLQDAAGANAYHIPEGIFGIYNPKKTMSQSLQRISTLDIAPSILSNFGVRPPSYMEQGFGL